MSSSVSFSRHLAVADKTSLRTDLKQVFENNEEVVNSILTLAYFSVLTGYSYNRVARWQRIERTPYSKELTPSAITYLTQSISEEERMALFRLRAARLKDDAVCAVDSTSRSAYGSSLADIKWGKNKEGISLPQTSEVVVYSLDDHMPVYYRTFPGNIPDSRSVETLLTDLRHAGFPNVALLTERSAHSPGRCFCLFYPGQACRFLDSALRAPLEMTGGENASLEMTGGRFLDSALRAPLEMTGGENASLEMTGAGRHDSRGMLRSK